MSRSWIERVCAAGRRSLVSAGGDFCLSRRGLLGIVFGVGWQSVGHMHGYLHGKCRHYGQQPLQIEGVLVERSGQVMARLVKTNSGSRVAHGLVSVRWFLLTCGRRPELAV